MRRLPVIILILLMVALPACTRAVDQQSWKAPDGSQPQPAAGQASLTPPVELAPGITPTPFQLPPTRDPSAPMLTPTPDAPHAIPTPLPIPESHIVQPGDTIGIISQKYGISPAALVQVNGLTDPNVLSVGQELKLPQSASGAASPSSFKIIPDSELVYGPFNMVFSVDEFVRAKNGYLAQYVETVDGKTMTGSQIVELVARNYSVSPRLLLAALEYRAGWVSNPAPDQGTLTYPLGYADGWHTGLYRQLTWAANALNFGYYGWKVNAIPRWVMADGTVVTPDASINAGTAGVQYFFSLTDDGATWQKDVSLEGLFSTYFLMFGYPFDYTIDPLLPPSLAQPPMQLPFHEGETWNFTGGPHGGWDNGSAWAALDFAPPGEGAGCALSDYWDTAVADGLILRADNGVVIQDLDGDGYESTGWVVLYMHVEERDRVTPGMYVRAGEKIGHPSCEGGVSYATHLHLARKYNGEWIPADGSIPFNLEGWISSGTGVEYDGYLTKDGVTLEAWDGYNQVNQITR